MRNKITSLNSKVTAIFSTLLFVCLDVSLPVFFKWGSLGKLSPTNTLRNSLYIMNSVYLDGIRYRSSLCKLKKSHLKSISVLLFKGIYRKGTLTSYFVFSPHSQYAGGM